MTNKYQEWLMVNHPAVKEKREEILDDLGLRSFIPNQVEDNIEVYGIPNNLISVFWEWYDLGML